MNLVPPNKAHQHLGKPPCTVRTLLLAMATNVGEAGEPFRVGELCLNCIDKKPAIARCTSCSRLLCEECLYQHKRQIDTKDHTVVESESAMELRERFQCNEHKKELTYCRDCRKPVCLHCTITYCREHKFDVAVNVKTLIEEKLTLLKDKAREFDSHFEHIESVQQKNATELARCEQEIDVSFTQVVQQLEERKGALIEELQQANSTQEAYISRHKDDVREKRDKLKECIGTTRELLSCRQESRLMVERDMHLEKMDELTLFEWSTDQVNPTKWQMRAPPKEEYAGKFGQILPKPQPEHILVGLKEKAAMGQSNKFTIQVEPKEQVASCNIDREVSVKIALTPVDSNGSHRLHATLLHRTITKQADNTWLVTFFPRGCGTLSISVSVCGVEARGSPFDCEVELGIKKGDKVVRAADWKWDDQDGGSGKIGEVIAVKGNGWVTVRWSGGKAKPGDYRWGKDAKFDIKVLQQN